VAPHHDDLIPTRLDASSSSTAACRFRVAHPARRTKLSGMSRTANNRRIGGRSTLEVETLINRQFEPGDRVRYSGRHMRQTGVRSSDVWTALACDCRQCASGEWLLIDRPSWDDSEPTSHVSRHALVRVGTPSHRDDP